MSEQYQFLAVADLIAWLHDQDINTGGWGAYGTKSVRNLWTEIHRGETRLEANPPLRLVQVVRVIIRRNERILVEAYQTFTDGRKRARNRPPSEKLMPSEDPLAAAGRCLVEEMGVSPESIVIHPDSYYQERFLGESASYPGLPSCYHFHVVEATVAGLPDKPFSTAEQAPGPGEPVSQHYWEWQEEKVLEPLGVHAL